MPSLIALSIQLQLPRTCIKATLVQLHVWPTCFMPFLTFYVSVQLTMSNWEVPVLSALQIRYAAFDVLIAGAVFRGLRFWHDKALPCSICSYAMGTAVQPQDFACSCGARFSDARRFGDHALSKGHTQAGKQCQRCSGCARYVMLPSQTKVEAPPPVLG